MALGIFHECIAYMKASYFAFGALTLAAALVFSLKARADEGQYKIVNTVQVKGSGAIDYLYADNDSGKLYVPRGGHVLTFDLETLKPTKNIPNTRGAHGVAVDPVSGHGFSSSKPVMMWDTRTLQTNKTIEVQGTPRWILFEPLTEKIYVFSHIAPNVTVIDGKDGSITGTIVDLGGTPEQAQSDAAGHVYVDLENKDEIAVVDATTMKLTGLFSVASMASNPYALALDNKNHILFAFCRNPAVAVILNALDGRILDALPIGKGTDGGCFNPATMEAFSSQGDGTLTIIKENNPTNFVVEQTLETMPRAKSCALDTKRNQILLTVLEPSTAPPATNTAPAAPVQATVSPDDKTVAAVSGEAPPAAESTPATPPAATPEAAAGGPPTTAPGAKPKPNQNTGPTMLDILVVGK